MSAAAFAPAAYAIDVTAGDWKLSIDGNVNAHYIYGRCDTTPNVIAGGLACTGTDSSASSVSNGLLPAALSISGATTQGAYDIGFTFGLYPGISTNDGGSPNLQAGETTGVHTALGTAGLDIRQVFLTFGNKEIGTFTFGRNFGLFGFDAIINDMTLPGVGVAGSASTSGPSNTTLGSIGFGYLYVDTLAQMDYTTPDIAGFNFTAGIFAPVNPIDGTNYTPKKAPGFHGKATYTLKMSDDMKFYASITGITQKQNSAVGTANGPSYTSNGGDIFAKFDVAGFEVDASYYYGKGMGTTGLFILASDGAGNARKSDGYLIQGTYTVGAVKFGVNYGVSKLDLATAGDDPFLLKENSKVTGGVYYSLTKNLTLLGEVSGVKTQAHNGNENKSTNGNFGAFMSF